MGEGIMEERDTLGTQGTTDVCKKCGYEEFIPSYKYCNSHRCYWDGEHLHRVCRRCGYDLRGNISGVCPECGEAC